MLLQQNKENCCNETPFFFFPYDPLLPTVEFKNSVSAKTFTNRMALIAKWRLTQIKIYLK